MNAPKAFAKAADVCINEPNTTTDVTQSLNKESQWQFNDTIKKKKKKKEPVMMQISASRKTGMTFVRLVSNIFLVQILQLNGQFC